MQLEPMQEARILQEKKFAMCTPLIFVHCAYVVYGSAYTYDESRMA